eukprot:752218-Hanusia_phi.AAC.11
MRCDCPLRGKKRRSSASAKQGRRWDGVGVMRAIQVPKIGVMRLPTGYQEHRCPEGGQTPDNKADLNPASRGARLTAEGTLRCQCGRPIRLPQLGE